MKREARKSTQVNEKEFRWGGFLVDADAAAALPFLRRATLASRHYDDEIVEEAWRGQLTIVTSNRRDFSHQILKFQNRQNNSECRDLFGLLVLPNAQLARERWLKTIRNGLEVPHHDTLRWPGAGFLNLYVRLTERGRTEVRRFKRCSFCDHPERGYRISKAWDGWFRSLPVIK